MTELLLPGDAIASEALPNARNQTKTLTLGPGLRHIPPSTVEATTAGFVASDRRKNAIWLENNGDGRYIPSVGDLVIATVQRSSADMYHCAICDHSPLATLPQLAFEGASKKTRPMLQQGSLVYARVSLANKHMDPELECVQPSTGKADGLGELKDGTVYEVSLGMARRLMINKSKDSGVSILEDLAAKGFRFEIAVGRNGRVWINGEDLITTLKVGSVLQQVDSKSLNMTEQEALAKKFTK